MPYVCKFCQRALKSKASHERHEINCLLNPVNKDKKPDEQPIKPSPSEAESLEIVVPSVTEKTKDTYKCGNCNGTLEKAEESCPHCGIYLKWN